MHASNKAQSPASPGLALQAGARLEQVMSLWRGALGSTVRCVPSRRTVMAALPNGFLFAKWRRGHRSAAAAEWHWLHLLPLLGVLTPVPVAFVGERRRTLIVTVGLPGRALDVWAVEAAREGWLPQLIDYACRTFAPVVRRLHDQGLVYRDLYWNHVFATDPRRGDEPRLLDVERVFRPRLTWRRWVIKDLAGLWSSLPVAVSTRAALRFLRAYLGGASGGPRGGQLLRRRRLVLAIAAKAERIRRHVPRYG
jgi:hypothetical protein